MGEEGEEKRFLRRREKKKSDTVEIRRRKKKVWEKKIVRGCIGPTCLLLQVAGMKKSI